MLRLLALPFVTCMVTSSQSLTWAEGAAPNGLSVRFVSEAAAGATPVTLLAGVEFLPLEITGRTLQQELDSTRSRRVVRNGLTRVELPDGGRVLAYCRDSGATYGYLLVRGNGAASVLLELPGLAGQTPFADRIGVSPDGHWGVASSAAATTLYLLRLDGTTYASTGTPARVLNLPSLVEVTTIMPGRSHVFFAGDDERMRRCAMADGGALEDVSPPPIAGARLKSELAMSGDGSAVVFLYGVQPSFSLWMVGHSGGPRRINAPIAKYEEPGYLPETAAGPRLLLNFDGTRLMYTDATLRDEIFVHDTTGTTATTHITGDHNFQPYIGIGIFPTFAAAVLVLGVGDPDRFDVFAATTGELPVLNLSRTNGNLTRPFGSGGLVPQAVTVSPSGAVLIADRPLGGALRLLRIESGLGQLTLIGDQLARLPTLADAAQGLPDVLVASADGDLLLDGFARTPFLVVPAGVAFTADVLLAENWRVLGVSAGGVSAIVFRAPDGTLIALPAVPGSQRPSMTRGNNLVIDGSSLLHVSPSAGVVRVQTAAPVRGVLSGLGA
jgi:hypothetical protein